MYRPGSEFLDCTHCDREDNGVFAHFVEVCKNSNMKDIHDRNTYHRLLCHESLDIYSIGFQTSTFRYSRRRLNQFYLNRGMKMRDGLKHGERPLPVFFPTPFPRLNVLLDLTLTIPRREMIPNNRIILEFYLG